MIYCDFDSLGKFAVKNVAIFKPFDKKISKFLKYYLESENYKKLIETKVKGTTQKFIPLNVLRNILLPLPPLEEQKRIVEKLDSLFEKIQKIKEIIEEVKRKLLQGERLFFLKHLVESLQRSGEVKTILKMLENFLLKLMMKR